MEEASPIGGGLTHRRSRANPGSNPASAAIEDAAQAAHLTTDKIVDKTTAQVDRLAGAAHRAVDSAAEAASSAAEWASTVPEQAKQVKTQLTDAASASIRARPIATVAGALVVGYLLGRLARL
jgi:hypothetical protein